MSKTNEDIASELLDSAKKAGADLADVIIMDSSDLSVACRLGAQEELERSESSDIGLRVWSGEKQAIISSSDRMMSKDSINELAKRAVDMARVATADIHAKQASLEDITKSWDDLDLYDASELSAEELYEMAKTAEDTARAVRGITNSEGAEAAYGSSDVTLATSAGFLGSHKTGSFSISVSVVAGEGEEMETDYDYSVARHVSDLDSPESVGMKAAENTIKRLRPRKVESCVVPVIFDPRVSKSLLSSFSSAISGSSIARGTSFLKDEMGKDIFSSSVTIIDDPLIKRGLASRPFDGEGIAGKKCIMVDKGELKSWFLDLRTASQLGLKTTGHASRGFASPPSPSSSNLYMKAGDISPEDMIKNVSQGFYITDVFGMGISITTGDYSQGASGFWIENGEIDYPVSEVTIAGKLQDMFKEMVPANDLKFKHATNCPTLRIDGMTIAGG